MRDKAHDLTESCNLHSFIYTIIKSTSQTMKHQMEGSVNVEESGRVLLICYLVPAWRDSENHKNCSQNNCSISQDSNQVAPNTTHKHCCLHPTCLVNTHQNIYKNE
jgi:hypothetical protein